MQIRHWAMIGAVLALGPYATNAGGQTVKSLYSFSDGAMPAGGVVFGPDGALYGTTSTDGLNGVGTIFRIDPGTGSLTVIYSFVPNASGYEPNAGVVFDSAGDIFGTAQFGGTNNQGVVFELMPVEGQGGWTESVVYSFSSVDGPGYSVSPNALTIGQNGLLYGVTTEGGIDGYLGTVFQLDPRTGAYVDLYDFPGGKNGAQPVAGVVIDGSGILYGTTMEGEGGGVGTVFSLNPNTDTLTTLHVFVNRNGGASDFPTAGLLPSSNSVFYGTTSGYGRYSGTVFSIDSTTRKFATLHTFKKQGGWAPRSGLAFGPNGNLYGTTVFGGNAKGPLCSNNGDGCGTLFQLDPTNRKLTTLYKFNGKDGAFPNSTLVMGSDGAFYGTTTNGGTSKGCSNPNGCGTVFRLTP